MLSYHVDWIFIFSQIYNSQIHYRTKTIKEWEILQEKSFEANGIAVLSFFSAEKTLQAFALVDIEKAWWK